MDCISHYMHFGHLNCGDGRKMSKSLKNFITVSEMIEKYTHNQIRMLFLLHNWPDTMDYSDDTMKHSKFYADLFKNFFLQTKSILLRPTTKHHKKFGPHEMKFFEYLEKVKLKIDLALRNNIDTPSSIKNLHELVSSLFTYVTTVESSETYVSEEIINDTISYVRQMLNIFGLDDFDVKNNPNGGKEIELLKVIQDIRTELRVFSKNYGTKLKPLDKGFATELQQSIFSLTDRVRDQMDSLGFPLTDK